MHYGTTNVDLALSERSRGGKPCSERALPFSVAARRTVGRCTAAGIASVQREYGRAVRRLSWPIWGWRVALARRSTSGRAAGGRRQRWR
eukprot:scaffold16981_cov122-Isochrysis_galbana.AAC.1